MKIQLRSFLITLLIVCLEPFETTVAAPDCGGHFGFDSLPKFF